MRKKLTFSIIALLILGLLYIIISYYRYLAQIKESHKNLKYLYKTYSLNFIDYYPYSDKDILFAYDWLNHTSGEKHFDDFLIKYGFGVANDSSENAIIYSYGKDNTDNKLLNNKFIDYDKFIKGYSITDFVFNDNIDIPLFKIEMYKINCDTILSQLDQDPFRHYKLLNNSEYIWSDENYKMKFLKLLTSLEKSLLNDNINNYSGRNILVIFKHNNVRLYCDLLLSKKNKKLLTNKIKSFLNKNDNFFDYAVFTLRVPKSMENK